MATALLSLARGQRVKRPMAMTGELTLTGRILAIGGLKEKTIAARRSGLKILVFPEDNRRDYEELPDYLKEGLEVHFVRTFDDAYRIVF